MLQDVAVPDVAAGVSLKWNDDAGDHGGVGADGVLPAGLLGGGRLGETEEVEYALGLIFEGVKGAAVEDLEAHQVQVDGVRVVGEVDKLPYLDGVQDGLFSNRRVPRGVVEQHAHGALDRVHHLVEGEPAGADGGGFGDAFDFVQGGGDGWRGLSRRGRVCLEGS